MESRTTVEQIKNSSFEKLRKFKNFSFNEMDEENFVIEFEEKHYLVQIVFRGLYNTDFEIADMVSCKSVYFMVVMG